MTYAETIDYLYKTLPAFSRIGAPAYKKDITNTVKLCEALGNPQRQFKSIHISGTNGKGSTSHILAAVLQSAGYKTGLYTSPHLKDFRERIKINGEMCSEDFVVQFVQQVQPLIHEIAPSFFEITVAMAFQYFALQKIDVAVIETGLGGRLDSTNIVLPELSVITNIGYDHTNMLGDTLDKIAFEKAGIIKHNTPVVVGEVLPETKPVFENTAAEKNAPMIIATTKRYVSDWRIENHLMHVTVVDTTRDEHTNYSLDLTGIYQTKNIITVLEALHQLQLKGFTISDAHIQHGLVHAKKLTGLHGRWELIHQHPSIVLDVAHNEDGIRQIAEQLRHITYHQLHIIIGMVKDKDVDAVLSLLPSYATYYFTKAQIPRALLEDELAARATTKGLQGKTFADVNSALQQALTVAHTNDFILVCGSVFLIGEVSPI